MERKMKWKFLRKIENNQIIWTDHICGGGIVMHVLQNRDQLKFGPVKNSNNYVMCLNTIVTHTSSFYARYSFKQK